MDKTLLEILACPVCKSSLIYDKQSQELVCKACRVAYPIRDEIPVMLIDEARELAAEEID
ncbi:MAG: Trm112 family protein [Methylophaga nitratireducenticrescens]|uniref:Trm112 family protein n=1 Tax=Methylophaga sp. SB9B TaxID=2570356 RepID=UPI0010A7974C|nr:Trm112 family protein [Methylophaga sp. SB9B]THF72487.1 MAG: Trm112 family protein [Methylophaga nitratireducenticrescens]THK42415.1 Trm112 family protein [Methylophaga sp. SB9B]